MKLFDFNKYFPDETACRKAFKEMSYFGEDLFDRLVMIAASYRTDFEHRIYNKKVA